MQRLKAAKAEAGSSAPDVAGVTAEAEKQRKLNLAAAQRFIKAGLGGDGSGAAPVKDIWADEDGAGAGSGSTPASSGKKRKAEEGGAETRKTPKADKEKKKKSKKSKKSK